MHAAAMMPPLDKQLDREQAAGEAIRQAVDMALVDATYQRKWHAAVVLIHEFGADVTLGKCRALRWDGSSGSANLAALTDEFARNGLETLGRSIAELPMVLEATQLPVQDSSFLAYAQVSYVMPACWSAPARPPPPRRPSAPGPRARGPLATPTCPRTRQT